MLRYKLSPHVEIDYLALVAQMTGSDVMNPDFDAMLEPLGLDFEVANPILVQLWESLSAAVDAAFAAGLACGLDPARLLLTAADGEGGDK